MYKRVLILGISMILVTVLFIAYGASVNNSASSNSTKQNMIADGERNGGNNYSGSSDTETDILLNNSVATKTFNDESTAVYTTTDTITGTGTGSGSISSAILSQRKVIRNANVSVEVDNFDIAYGKLKSTISAFGYIQESNIKKEKQYEEEKEILVTKGIIVVRVDKDKFDSVLDGIKGLGLLTEENISSDDVTEKFFDTESRLKILRIEEGRLEEYLKKANNMDTIFKTEGRLTEIRYEIEGLTGTLKKWANLVELSTITLNMGEKDVNKEDKPEKDETFWEKISGGFRDSLEGVAAFCGEGIIFLAQAIPVLILLGILGILGLLGYRKVTKRRRVREEKKDGE